MAKLRLQKVLAAAGVGSRRKCEELILNGMVEVNRKIVNKLPVFVDPQQDFITINGRKIQQEKKVYFLLNKPKGIICTSSDPRGRKKAIDLIPSRERIFCAGRLDADTTGIIILTNDSELTNKLTHPRYEVPKTYVVKVKGQISSTLVEKLNKGIWLAEGKTSACSVKILKNGHEESLIEITIRQGLNRQVRRMLAKVALRVTSLKRTRIGNLTINGLNIGKFRAITKAEIKSLTRRPDSRRLHSRNRRCERKTRGQETRCTEKQEKE
jgi:23S rRNA pseudouridine2605 synthase